VPHQGWTGGHPRLHHVRHAAGALDAKIGCLTAIVIRAESLWKHFPLPDPWAAHPRIGFEPRHTPAARALLIALGSPSNPTFSPTLNRHRKGLLPGE